ncbi:unnamed protein product [Fraxinus pennsylvanica]|uniref:Uncharacterized protein n=1 Tax=Fraxinus pennsylvanica TaxID=56036 RepID=A0AAD2DRM7_9LAMI|nr:unnamed protein product [Fraxinus pennsylvanica]
MHGGRVGVGMGMELGLGRGRGWGRGRGRVGSFGVINKEPTKRFFFATKNNDKFNLAKVSIDSDVKSSISTAKKETTLKEKKAKEYNLKRVIVPGDTQTDQSMSWRMPHKKRGQKDPGFNLDYLPPKTHPPVHN